MPGFVGMANTLCSCESKYNQIRDSLLGRVAVAEDLDSATAIAKRTGYRLRVVSLDGQVVNAGGSLTGGSKGRTPGCSAGHPRSQRVREKAAALQKQADAAQQEFRQRQGELSSCERNWTPPVGSCPLPKKSGSALLRSAPGFPRSWSSWRKPPPIWSGSRRIPPAVWKSFPNGRKEVRAAIAQLEEQVNAAQEENQALSGSRQEQMARCDDISQTIQEIRMGEFPPRKTGMPWQLPWPAWRSGSGIPPGLWNGCKGRLPPCRRKTPSWSSNARKPWKTPQRLKDQAQAKREESLEAIAQKRQSLEQESQKLREREREAISQRENVGRELSRLQERSDNLQKEYDQIISGCGKSMSSPGGRPRKWGKRLRTCPLPRGVWPS